MNPLLSMSATRLAALIRSREVSSLEVVEAHIQRIREVNPSINAVVRDRFDQAREEARAAGARVRECAPAALGPLHGVPCTIKEAFALTGMPNTSGLLLRKDVVAVKDATGVARLRAAGAIPIGVTNVSELCMWMETANLLYGRTRNPYDPRHIVGGSSGGEGAIVAAGGSPFGLAADVGGSIRMPAFFNGVFGHKPTGGLVPNTGQYPLAANQALRYLTTGPIARKAEDLMPLLRILAGPDGEDAGCRSGTLGDPAQVDIRRLRVLLVDGDGVVRVSRELREAQARAADKLAAMGADVTRDRIPGLRRSVLLWSAMMSAAGGPTFSELMGGGRPVRAWWELLRWTVGRPRHTLPAIGLSALEVVPKLTRRTTRKLVQAGQELREELVSRIGPDGVMLYPSYSCVAPRHHIPLLKLIHFAYTCVINVLELPATQVPLGLGRQGLPLGVQVVGIHGNDHVTIAVAQALEQALGGWVAPWKAGQRGRRES